MNAAIKLAVGRMAGWLAEVYALELGIRAEDFVLSLSVERARELLPAGCRSGVILVEQHGEARIGLHLDPEDHRDEGTLVEETSHLVCLAWHAARDLPISRLLLELQADVDRFVFSRLNALRSDREALTHFECFRWADGLDEAARDRYELAHDRAHHYCRRLNDRFPRRADIPGLVSELRRFYRASPESKLRAA